jgi:hypothetical protein
VDSESKWLELFAKLGVYSKVHVLCEPQEEIMELDNFNDTFIQEDESAGTAHFLVSCFYIGLA